MFLQQPLSLRIALAALLLVPAGWAQEHVTFSTQDGGTVHADLYGNGPHGVVLVHGGRFNKEIWRPQARILETAGLRVLAINLRGYGESHGPGEADVFSAPLHFDVLAAVRYLRKAGCRQASVVGGSLGGGAAADATVQAKPGEIDALVGLGNAAGRLSPARIQGRKLFIVARDEADGSALRLPGFQAEYEKMREPKRLIILEGSAHAQALFESQHSERVMSEILRFLQP